MSRFNPVIFLGMICRVWRYWNTRKLRFEVLDFIQNPKVSQDCWWTILRERMWCVPSSKILTTKKQKQTTTEEKKTRQNSDCQKNECKQSKEHNSDCKIKTNTSKQRQKAKQRERQNSDCQKNERKQSKQHNSDSVLTANNTANS